MVRDTGIVTNVLADSVVIMVDSVSANSEAVLLPSSTDSSSVAISVSGAHKYYGSLHVLNNLDMTVPYGCIYGLLGSSGCGKTTLLRCILGRLQLAEGNITVLGKPPGSKGHQIPGRDVGYMPQDIALYDYFTMAENMYYFGVVHGLKPKEIKQRIEFLTKLLDLPSTCNTKNTYKLSGGQQRRVSLAVAMLQEPPLLILDEPTVGMDPLLRAKIWQHLLALVRTTKITIVLTTHYIEEARQAHMVGLMRNGSLLAESPPTSLMKSYDSASLEGVFLYMCNAQDMLQEDRHGDFFSESVPLIDKERKRDYNITNRNRKVFKDSHCYPLLCSGSSCSCDCRGFLRNICALMLKQLIRLIRNPILRLFLFLVPILQILLTYFAFGRPLTDIDIAVSNSAIGSAPPVCNVSNFGSVFTSKLDSKTLNLKYFSSSSIAIDQVVKGKAWAAIVIPIDFSSVNPYIDGPQIPSDSNNGSAIEIYEDVTDLLVTFTLHKELIYGIKTSMKEVLHHCDEYSFENIQLSLSVPPFKLHRSAPVYGRFDSSYTDYVMPGIIIGIIHTITFGLITIESISERKNGLTERIWVAGVGIIEEMIARFVSQLFPILIQSIMLLILVIYGFKVYIADKWDIVLIGTVTVFQSITGLSFGTFLSSICDQETTAFQIIVGINFPLLLLSGLYWPLFAMPKPLQYISRALPTTHSIQSVTLIMERGWGVDHIEVLNGLLVPLLWTFILVTLSIFIMKLKQN